MSQLQPVRGTHDLLPDEARKHRHVVSESLKLAEKFGFEEIVTPIFESTQVFARTLGEASDIVSKEMYTFADRGGDSLTLRPEGTAGVARAIISNGLFQHMPLKLFYSGPMFRYERPQKGRNRQFYQIGVECLGQAGWTADVEVIALGYEVLKALSIADSCQLKINSLGDEASRANYRDALVKYLSKYENELSADSKTRLQKNPLRILDSKDPNDQKITAGSPKLQDHLTPEAKDFKNKVLQGLTALKIPFVEDNKLVRGLDYYTHSVFEFVTQKLGAQDAVLAGGRYDGLISQMGGNPTPGVGWAAGVERLSLLLDTQVSKTRPIVVLPMSDNEEIKALEVAQELRQKTNFPVEFLSGGQLGKRMKKAASRYQAKYALILGEQELQSQSAMLKDLDSGEQKLIPLKELATHL